MNAGLLDRLVSLIPERPTAVPDAVKAVSGSGYWTSLTNPPISAFQRDSMRMARLSQDAYLANRHIRGVERLIAGRFSTVDWHLEDETETRIGRGEGENAAPEMLAVLDLLERPYAPQVTDPRTATPRTRSTLWNIGCRHAGLAGYGFWYLDETEPYAHTPRSILYINPARMKPATDKQGNLTGWVLDPDDYGGGTPLPVENVIILPLEPPDSGFLPSGLVESAMSMVDLTRSADRHAQGVLAAGGRLSGFVSPKGDAEWSEEQYDQLVKDFRNAAEDPASARRLNVLRGPAEFSRLSATPQELDLVGVMNLTRDEVHELWNVPRSQVGGQVSTGMNSGDSKGYDEAVLWQNAVGPRLKAFAETVQYELLDRYQALGLTIRLVIEEPEFDDETPLYERASKAVTQPLTNLERRALLGMEPFGDERDDEVWMASTMSRVYPEAEPPPQLAPFIGQAPPPPATPVDEDETDEDLREDAVKASMREVSRRALAVIERDVRTFLAQYGQATASRVRQKAEHLAQKPRDVDAVFDAKGMERELLRLMEPHLRAVAEGAGGSVAIRFGKAELRDPVLDRLLRSAGVRVKGISETTRSRLQDVLAKGIAEGLSAQELGDLVETSGGIFDEARAETIARTETATVLNEAAVAQYAEFGVEQVIVSDGDDDEACASADGETWSLERAEAEPIAHPNCTRAFSPVIAGGAAA